MSAVSKRTKTTTRHEYFIPTRALWTLMDGPREVVESSVGIILEATALVAARAYRKATP